MCEQMKMKMTRRAFLETTALAAAGLTLGACSPRQEGRIAAQPFGRTRHRSTRIIFGGYAFSSVIEKERVEQTIAALQEYGVNHIDTAPSYGGSHIWLGMVMKDHRDEYFLATNGSVLATASETTWSRLRATGIRRLQLTLYGLEQTHDAFAGRSGAFRDVIVRPRQ